MALESNPVTGKKRNPTQLYLVNAKDDLFPCAAFGLPEKPAPVTAKTESAKAKAAAKEREAAQNRYVLEYRQSLMPFEFKYMSRYGTAETETISVTFWYLTVNERMQNENPYQA